jgi:hypothetical protein
MDRSQDLAPTLPPSSPAGRQELDRLFPVVYEELEETALALDASPATIKRDWRLARAWLKRELLA